MLKIFKLNNQKTVNFASLELKKYLKIISNKKIEIIHITDPSIVFKNQEKKRIILGVSNGLENIIKKYKFPKSEDEIWIKPYKENLVLSGSNYRSVLFSVYTLLHELGVSWIYPGKEGEIINKKNNLDLFNISMHHKASLKYRGIAIEGAVKLPQILDFIDWMAKNFMNHFFMQFQSCYNFYKWYDPSIDEKKGKVYDEILIKEIKKRGMILERVGHGWISQSLGLNKEGWGKTSQKISVKKQKYLAKVKGKRSLLNNIAIYSQMCMSNKEATDILINYVCDYAEKHKEIDILAFWLADGFNNLCECDNCIKHHPSDLYIRIVNKLSDRLFKINPNMKLEIIGYANIIEPPITENIKNHNNNLVFIFAPITRCWIHSLNDKNCKSSESLKYWPDINKIGEIKNKEYIELLKRWLDKFDGDNYLFDYYNWIWGCRDFIKTELPKIISMDLKSYNLLGVKGIVSCGTERAFWPTGISMNVLAHLSWNTSKNYKDIEDEYLKNAFKKDANIIKKYIHEIYSLTVDENDYKPAHNYKTWKTNIFPDYKNKTKKLDKIIINLIEKKQWLKEKYNLCKDNIIKKRWFYLLTHLVFLIMLFELEKIIIKGNKKRAISKLKDIQKYLKDNRKEIEDVCDIFEINYRFLEPKLEKILSNNYS